ncbi:MAG: OmpA family protein [Crocinitomicaceae bacterium]
MKLFIRTLFFTLILGSANMSFGQTPNYAKKAYKLYNAGLYVKAADALKKASEQTSTKTPEARKLKGQFAYMSGDCFRMLHDFPAAEQQYEKAILLKYYEIEPKVYYYLGQMQMGQGNHSEALRSYKKHAQLNPSDELTKIRIQSCEQYKAFIKNGGRHEMSPMTKLNTAQFDYGTVMNSRGNTIYFTSSRPAATGDQVDMITNQDYSDIFMSVIDRKGNYSEPVPMGSPVNTIHSEGTIAFDGRGKKMFFTRCVNIEAENLGCDIYVTEAKGKSFTEPVKLEIKDHDSTHVGHPAVSKDGNTLIFASNMAGGEGGVDLWMSTYERRSDSWSLAVNLGPEINSAGNDMFPKFGKNGELYFSTDGRVGAGGLDIFVAQQKGKENVWMDPTNLGDPLNSYADDYHIIFTQSDENGTKGFISSNRAGSKGPRENPSQDIWSFYLPPVIIGCNIIVVDQENGNPVPNKEVKLIGTDGTNIVLTTDENGEIELNEKADGTRYIKPGGSFTIDVPTVPKVWLGNRDKFSTENIGKPTTIIREIAILNIESGPIRLPEVRYDLARWELQVIPGEINSKDSLNFLYDLMVSNPNIVVQLNSHTDSRGSDAANRTLAQKRAQSCVDYLVNEKGLPRARFVPKGYGEDRPATYQGQLLTESYINKFKSSDKARFEMLHQKNRRTDCEIISYDYVK